MAATPLVDYADLSLSEFEPLARTVREHRGLDEIFAWGRTQTPAVVPADVLLQDEFTHDVLVPLPTGRWLVYGTTCLGGVTGVSVWGHKPSAQEILEKRLAAGWKPTPSHNQDGDVIEGYAACLSQGTNSARK